MTGRAAGYCAGFAVPGFANRGAGRGLGRGFGYGRGRRGGRGMGLGRGPFGWRGGMGAGGFGEGVMPTASAVDERDELAWLEQQAEVVRREQESLQRRIDELKNAADASSD